MIMKIDQFAPYPKSAHLAELQGEALVTPKPGARKKRNYLLGACAAASLATGFAQAVYPVGSALTIGNAIEHSTGTTSKDEQKIEQALERTFGGRFWINCTYSYEDQPSISREKHIRAMASPGEIKVITMKQYDCDEVVTYAADPQNYQPKAMSLEDLGYSLSEYGVSEEEVAGFYKEPSTRFGGPASAFHTLSHEAAHTQGIANESEAQCFSYQAMSTILSKGFGVNTKEANELTNIAVSQYDKDEFGLKYNVTPECNPSELNYGFDNAFYVKQ